MKGSERDDILMTKVLSLNEAYEDKMASIIYGTDEIWSRRTNLSGEKFVNALQAKLVLPLDIGVTHATWTPSRWDIRPGQQNWWKKRGRHVFCLKTSSLNGWQKLLLKVR